MGVFPPTDRSSVCPLKFGFRGFLLKKQYCLISHFNLFNFNFCVLSPPTDNIIKRVFNIIKFTWVLFQTTVESFTKWMNDMCREYIDISTVLKIERCMLTREVKKVPRTSLLTLTCRRRVFKGVRVKS